MNLVKSLINVTDPVYTTTVVDLKVKEHLKVEIDDDDALILAYMKAAFGLVETLTNRQLLTRNVKAYMDRFPCGGSFYIPRCPVSVVSTIKYYDEDEIQQTFSTAFYETDINSLPARVALKYNQTWPTIYTRMNCIEIAYTVGYATIAAVPEDLKLAILLITDHFYNNRAEVSSIELFEIPLGIKALCLPYRVFKWDY